MVATETLDVDQIEADVYDLIDFFVADVTDKVENNLGGCQVRVCVRRSCLNVSERV